MSPAKTARPTKPTIVVAGDLSVDWFEFETPPRGPAKGDPARYRSWRDYPSVRRESKAGGTWLMAEFIAAATEAEVLAPPLRDARTVGGEEMVHAYVELGRFPAVGGRKDEKPSVFRVRSYKGFTGPAGETPSAFPFEPREVAPALVVLDDAGNGFGDHENLWPPDLSNGAKPLVLVKAGRPDMAGPLFDHLRRRHADRLVLVVDADEMRREGIKLSRRLSWERTATEFVWQMASNPALQPLNACAAVVARFGIDGAILYVRGKGGAEGWLYYDPSTGEGDAGEVWPGEMVGTGSAFAAGLAAALVERGLDGLRAGVGKGLLAARRLRQAGFGTDPERLAYPGREIFRPLEPQEGTIAEVRIPAPSAAEPADPGFWCILDSLSRSDLESIAYEFVLKGKDPLLEQVPSGRFRFLRTFDRTEIESFRGIKNLVGEYLASPSVGRPLSIAVFGAPGSGKSFGVNEVAESVAPGRLQKIEFNLSQFNAVDELVAAFHRVRDIALGGRVPIVFFDEFDAAFNGPLGWLKYFLAPMQDGAFSDGHDVHPLGRAIFVFAGGTASSYKAFCSATEAAAFKAVKGPDFVSRLRGYVNIKGPNPIDDQERLFLVRRAQILRFQLEKSAPQIFDGKTCRIDPGILRAMIKVPEYRHGIRSMLAVIEMSQLSGRRSFEQAALPSPEQLELHVDAEAFSRLVVRDVLLGSARETLARAIHERYRREKAGQLEAADPALADWAALDGGLKESNRRQADHIPAKLRAVGCDFGPAPAEGKAARFDFAAGEIETMAKMEHERWVAEKLLAGFTAGPRDPAAKTSPYLVPWDDLDEQDKNVDRQAVRGIPELLASAGFEIYRLKKG